MIEHITPRLVQPGMYLEKKNVEGWLRMVLTVEGDYCTWVDRVGFSQGDVFTSTVTRWAKAAYTEEEARTIFPDECRKIDEVITSAKTHADLRAAAILDAMKPLLRLLLRGVTGNAVGVGRPDAEQLIALLRALGINTGQLNGYELTDRLEQIGQELFSPVEDRLENLADDALIEALKNAAARLAKPHPSSQARADHRFRDALNSYAAALADQR